MYRPEMFAETRDAEIARILNDFPLATLVTQNDDGLRADHIPMVRESADRMIGHIALANDLHERIADGAPILAVFRAEDAYVSPNWYPTKTDHHRHVPTWNYQAVHVAGAIRFLRDPKSKRAIVGKLTKHFEASASPDQPWRMADAPADYLEQMLNAIVGFEIAVSRVTAKSKLSQNRESIDFDSVTRALDKAGRTGIATVMKAL